MTTQEQYADFFRVGSDLSSGITEMDPQGSKSSDFGKNPLKTAELTDSNAVCSRLRDVDQHKVVIDLDMDAALIPSSTPGHFHLIIDKQMPWCDYSQLLAALHTAGVIQKGYYEASINRGASVIRTPWTKKDLETKA